MNIHNHFFNDNTISIIKILESSVKDYKIHYPELYEFWKENFTQSLKKTKKKLSKNNLRRNFQGRVVNAIITKERPQLILNLFAGFLGNFHAIFQNSFFNIENGLKFLWINIDILEESIDSNCEYLSNEWNFTTDRFIEGTKSKINIFPNGIMIHIIGDLTRIDLVYQLLINLTNYYSSSAIFALEGIMNLPLLTQQQFTNWWEVFKKIIESTTITFGSWMASGDDWAGLLTKLFFYQQILTEKHKQPFAFGELKSIKLVHNGPNLEEIIYDG
ncbi:MAG: hypothetical protein ACFFD1_04060, partial [Candidatus Thorarchaeota archaeon]